MKIRDSACVDDNLPKPAKEQTNRFVLSETDYPIIMEAPKTT